jgi:hypothetical protein
MVTPPRFGPGYTAGAILSDIPPIPGGWLSRIALSERFDNDKSRIALQQSVKSSRLTAARR